MNPKDHRKLLHEMPIYIKAEEIYTTVRKISELIPDDNRRLQDIKYQILGDAGLLSVKITGAEAGRLYDIKMENAAIIRKAARDLIVSQHSLEAFGFKEYDYFNIVREQMEEFRLLFIDWVESFDKTTYIIDRWGLFNPPGVGPHDHDPDDDIPFDPDDFFDEKGED